MHLDPFPLTPLEPDKDDLLDNNEQLICNNQLSGKSPPDYSSESSDQIAMTKDADGGSTSITHLQPFALNLSLIDNAEPFDYKIHLNALKEECRQLAQQWPIPATDKASSHMEQPTTPAPPQRNLPHTHQTIIHFQPLDGILPQTDAVKPFNDKLCLIVQR